MIAFAMVVSLRASNGNNDKLVRFPSLFETLCSRLQNRIVTCCGECCLVQDMS
jgi:hypothetical protein